MFFLTKEEYQQQCYSTLSPLLKLTNRGCGGKVERIRVTVVMDQIQVKTLWKIAKPGQYSLQNGAAGAILVCGAGWNADQRLDTITQFKMCQLTVPHPSFYGILKAGTPLGDKVK